MPPRDGLAWPIAPMKATSTPLPRGGGWAYEPKWDGHRTLVRVRAGEVEARSSTGQLRSWPFLAELAGLAGAADLVLDGEVVAFDEHGRHRFQLVGRPDRTHAFVVFDVLVHDGHDLTARPWVERRAVLEAIGAPSAHVMLTPVSRDPDALLRVTREAGFEGVIAKEEASRYQAGRRSPSWRKVKHRREQELVVGGYLVGEGARAPTFGSLLVGVHDAGVLRFVGAVGTGFDEARLRALTPRLRALEQPECPFRPVPKLRRGRPCWMRPELVVQVGFTEWTDDGNIRQPVFLGERQDVDPSRVVREP